jgi:glucosamine-6-phosphate deaminase
MDITVRETKTEMGAAAAFSGALRIRKQIANSGSSSIVLATGASQFEMLDALVAAEDIDWSVVTAYHLDEYIGLDANHGASFRRYLRERFVERLPKRDVTFVPINPGDNPAAECQRLNALISKAGIDVAFIGIGENGHLAFNDPPADFETTDPYQIVTLDAACRRQQLGEGWFAALSDVPTRAISMTMRQIMTSKYIVCTVPDARKAIAVREAVEGPVTPDLPASLLKEHPNCHLFLDHASSVFLRSR